MTKNTVNEVIRRAISDVSFRDALRTRPAEALAGFKLTAAERSAVTSGDPERLTALGVDQRLSKAFAVGALGDASKTIIGDLVGTTGHMAFDEDLNAGRTFTLAAADDESAAARRLRFIEQDLNASADEAGELSGAPGTAAIDDGGVSGSGDRLRILEQDLDTGAAVTAEPAGEKYLTEDEALLAYQASLAASVGTGAESINAMNLRRIEQDLDAGQSVDSTPSDVEPTEY